MLKFLFCVLVQINSNLQSFVLQFQQEQGIKHGIVAAKVVDLSSGEAVVSVSSDKSVNSASTLKLISTGTALLELGPDFTFSTKVGYTGVIRNGVLEGDLILIPSGDPSFGSTRFLENEPISQIINTLKATGIHRITGSVSLLDLEKDDFSVPNGWPWIDIGNYYGALPMLFNWHENYYSVYFDAPSKEGGQASIYELKPADTSWKIQNEVKAGPKNSGDQVYIYKAPHSSDILMKGTVPVFSKMFEVKGSMHEPAKLFITSLQDGLEKAGIEVSRSYDGKKENAFYQLLEITSPPLSKLATECNFRSINLYADAFVAYLAFRKQSEFSIEKGAAILKDFYSSAGLNMSGFYPQDGSGLSPRGLVTAASMTEILRYISQSPFFESFQKTIPVLGQEGTVKYLDRENKTKGRVLAKSGSISGTRAFAGYSQSHSGRQFAYYISVSNYPPEASGMVRDFLEKFLIQMVEIP